MLFQNVTNIVYFLLTSERSTTQFVDLLTQYHGIYTFKMAPGLVLVKFFGNLHFQIVQRETNLGAHKCSMIWAARVVSLSLISWLAHSRHNCDTRKRRLLFWRQLWGVFHDCIGFKIKQHKSVTFLFEN